MDKIEALLAEAHQRVHLFVFLNLNFKIKAASLKKATGLLNNDLELSAGTVEGPIIPSEILLKTQSSLSPLDLEDKKIQEKREKKRRISRSPSRSPEYRGRKAYDDRRYNKRRSSRDREYFRDKADFGKSRRDYDRYEERNRDYRR